MMGNIFYACLDVLSKAVGDICLFCVDIAAGTMSWGGVYEPEMPAALRPKDEEAETEQ
jgi:cyclic lactone autoinducer peptide